MIKLQKLFNIKHLLLTIMTCKWSSWMLYLILKLKYTVFIDSDSPTPIHIWLADQIINSPTLQYRKQSSPFNYTHNTLNHVVTSKEPFHACFPLVLCKNCFYSIHGVTWNSTSQSNQKTETFKKIQFICR